jgi:hypothetical protein
MPAPRTAALLPRPQRGFGHDQQAGVGVEIPLVATIHGAAVRLEDARRQ